MIRGSKLHKSSTIALVVALEYTERWPLSDGYDRRTAIDVGANVGDFTNEMRRWLFRDIHAFEPADDCADKLRQRFADAPNVSIYRWALSDKPGKASLTCDGKDKPRSRYLTDGGSFDVMTLDDVGFQNVDLLKVDVEGAELLVLKGGENMLRRDSPTLIIERDPPHNLRFGYTDEEMVKWLRQMGYVEVAHVGRDHIYVRTRG